MEGVNGRIEGVNGSFFMVDDLTILSEGIFRHFE